MSRQQHGRVSCSEGKQSSDNARLRRRVQTGEMTLTETWSRNPPGAGSWDRAGPAAGSSEGLLESSRTHREAALLSELPSLVSQTHPVILYLCLQRPRRHDDAVSPMLG
ncbi:uncharacterized protein V6R79_004525 [Siganus canaliculatus]